ncbi:MAG: restriction endonuclease subunit S [Crocinitomicaceae bacterium]|nr:restriction endonuclease subunit S [Crocinitomicaceae bacterium]
MAKKNNSNTNNLNIPKGWKYLPFGNVFEFIQSLALSREQLTFDEHEGEIFNLHYGDIHATYKTDLLDFDKRRKVPRIKKIVESKSLSFLKEGDLIIADASEDYKGVAANLELKNIKSKKVTGGLHTFVARDNSGLTVKGFRTYVLKNPAVTNELKKLATGSKVYGVSKTNLTKLKVLLPTLKEQLKISQILFTWDALIETLEQLIYKKERSKKVFMQHFLSPNQKHGNDSRKSYLLGSICDFLDGQRRPIKEEDRAKIKGKYPYYGASGIIDYVNDFIFDDDLILLGEDGENILSRALPLAFRVSGKCWVNNHAHVLKPKENVNIVYLTNYLENISYEKYNSGTAQPKLNKKICESIPILLPSIDEQKKIASILSASDLEIEILKKELHHIERSKIGLMQILLTGKTRVGL